MINLATNSHLFQNLQAESGHAILIYRDGILWREGACTTMDVYILFLQY